MKVWMVTWSVVAGGTRTKEEEKLHLSVKNLLRDASFQPVHTHKHTHLVSGEVISFFRVELENSINFNKSDIRGAQELQILNFSASKLCFS